MALVTLLRGFFGQWYDTGRLGGPARRLSVRGGRMLHNRLPCACLGAQDASIMIVIGFFDVLGRVAVTATCCLHRSVQKPGNTVETD